MILPHHHLQTPQVEALSGIVTQLQGSSLDASFDGPPRDQAQHIIIGVVPPDSTSLLPPGGRDVERLVPKLVECIEDSHHKVVVGGLGWTRL